MNVQKLKFAPVVLMLNNSQLLLDTTTNTVDDNRKHDQHAR